MWSATVASVSNSLKQLHLSLKLLGHLCNCPVLPGKELSTLQSQTGIVLVLQNDFLDLNLDTIQPKYTALREERWPNLFVRRGSVDCWHHMLLKENIKRQNAWDNYLAVFNQEIRANHSHLSMFVFLEIMVVPNFSKEAKSRCIQIQTTRRKWQQMHYIPTGFTYHPANS